MTSMNDSKNHTVDYFLTNDILGCVDFSAYCAIRQKPLNTALGTTALGVVVGTTIAGVDSSVVKVAQITGAVVAGVCAIRAGHSFIKNLQYAQEKQEHHRNLPSEVLADANARINAENARHDGVVGGIFHEIDGTLR